MEKYLVIKTIKRDRKKLAKIGQVLTVFKDYNRIGGVEVLKKGDTYVCDVGSRTANTCCEKILDGTKITS